ncbi:ATP-dependent Clp protease adapter protein CLPS2, chloroplastic [Elaeis guineensis]|uniref:ATP-dependent Clp protease adapter protein CLPS1, chloroplastic n=1 Tax=Elaeis guineensis var. tenera TaxID=51953 RepID=A0A6J0PPS2_ELAGV|nr:ATP-dependent Clp protease adapter protein CLPS1, chloroplastic [Elaeis guineensis]
MAINSRGAAYPALKLSNSIPLLLPFSNVSMPFKPTNVKLEKIQQREMVFSTKGSLGSLKGGTGLLERPTFDQSQFDPLPQAQEGGDIGRLSDRKGLGSGDSYKVLMIDDIRHTETLVEKALPQVVPSITAADARKLFHESRQKGVAVVIVTVKEHAEFYAQMMVRWGLRSAIEPDSNIAE